MNNTHDGLGLESSDLFIENEKTANSYVAKCMFIIGIIAILVWLLNSIGMFVVPKRLMAFTMPIAIALFFLPLILVKTIPQKHSLIKYASMLCSIIGIGLLSSMLNIHLVIAWSCPMLLTSHYYSKKLTAATLALSLIFMTASIFISLYFGDWDANLIGMTREETASLIYPGLSFAELWAMLDDMSDKGTLNMMELKKLAFDALNDMGRNRLLDVFKFFVLPRCMILCGLAPISLMLATRTHNLILKQKKDSEEKQRISTELNVATQIQADMLPGIFPAFPAHDELDIYATMQPAKEVGGDFYDFFSIDSDHIALVIADVSGKGVPAALFMVIAKTLIKNHAQSGGSPADVLAAVNTQLCENNTNHMFVTAWIGILEISTGKLSFSNAGHNPPLVKRGGGSYEYLRITSGFVLGGMASGRYRQSEITLSKGDTLYLYTDGVTEASNALEEFYGENRLQKILNGNPDADPAQLLTSVKTDMDLFCQEFPQYDDITMLALKIR